MNTTRCSAEFTRQVIGVLLAISLLPVPGFAGNFGSSPEKSPAPNATAAASTPQQPCPSKADCDKLCADAKAAEDKAAEAKAEVDRLAGLVAIYEKLIKQTSDTLDRQRKTAQGYEDRGDKQEAARVNADADQTSAKLLGPGGLLDTRNDLQQKLAAARADYEAKAKAAAAARAACDDCHPCPDNTKTATKTGTDAKAESATRPDQTGTTPPLSAQQQADAVHKKIQDFYRDRAGKLEGSRTVNGLTYQTDTIARMIAIRDIYVKQLQQFISAMSDLASGPQATRDARIHSLLPLATRLEAAHYLAAASGPTTGPQDAWVIRQMADAFDQAGNKTDAAWLRSVADLKAPERAQIAQREIREILDQEPLLGISAPGLFGESLETHIASGLVPAPRAAEALRPVLLQYIEYAIQQSHDEINRVNGFTTTEEFAEFLKPQYARTRLFAGQAYGGMTEIENFEDFARLYNEYSAAKEEQGKLTLAIVVGGIAVVAIVAAPAAGLLGAGEATVATVGAVGSAANFGGLNVVLVWDGKEWLAVSKELEQAQKGAAVLGQSNLEGLEQKKEAATGQVLADVFFAVLAYKDFRAAMQRAQAARTTGAGSTTGRSAGTGAPATAVTLTPELQAIANEFGEEVALGVRAGRLLRVPEEAIQKVLKLARLPESLKTTPLEVLEVQNPMGLQLVKAALTSQQALANLRYVNDFVLAAREAGVSQAAIEAAWAAAQKAGTVEAWGILLRRQLGIEQVLVEIQKRGGVVLLHPQELADLTTQEAMPFVRAQPTGGLIQTGAGADLLSLRAKITLLAKGRVGVKLTAEDVRLLNQHVLPEGEGILKWFGYDPDLREFFQIFDKNFLDDLRRALKDAARAGNKEADRALATLEFSTAGAEEAAARGTAAGTQVDLQYLRTDQVGSLTDRQLRNFPKHIFDLLPPDTQKAIREEIMRRGLLAKSGISAEEAPVVLNAEQGAERFAQLAKRLSNEDLQKLAAKLAGDPKADPTLKAAIQNEYARRFPSSAQSGAAGKSSSGAGAGGASATGGVRGTAMAGRVSQGCQLDMESIMACRRQCDRMCREAQKSSETQQELNRLNARLGLGGDVQEAQAEARARDEAAANAPEGTSFEEKRKLDEAADQAQQRLNDLLGPLKKQQEALDKKLSEELERCLRECYQKCVLCPVETPLQMTTGTTVGKSDKTPASGSGDAADGATAGRAATPAANPGTPLWPRPMQDHLGLDLSLMKKRLWILEGGSPEEQYEELSRRSEGSRAGLPKSAEELSDHEREKIANDLEKEAQNFDREGNKKKADLKRRIVAKLRSPGGCATSPTQTATGNIPAATSTSGTVGGSPANMTTSIGTNAANAPSSSASTGTTGAGSFLSITSGVAGLINTGFSAPVAPFEQNLTIAQGFDYTFSGDASSPSGSPGGSSVASLNSDFRDGFPPQRLRASLQPAALRMSESFLTFSSSLAMRLAIAEDSWLETPSEITYSLVANGNSSGEALQLQVFDPSGRIKQVDMPEGTVLEPLKMGAAQPVAARAPRGANLLTKQLTAYCVDYLKLPPQVGMLYRVAPQAVQDKFKPMRAVLQAGRQLAASGGLHPDSDPKEYADAIRQYALWSKLENWGEQKFTEMFVERTKKNAQAMNVKWTKQMENALLGMAPGRWRDISMVLAEAQKLSSADTP